METDSPDEEWSNESAKGALSMSIVDANANTSKQSAASNIIR